MDASLHLILFLFTGGFVVGASEAGKGFRKTDPSHLSSRSFLLILGTQLRGVWMMTPLFLFILLLGLPTRNWYRAMGVLGGTLVSGIILSRRFYAALIGGADH